MIRLLRTILCVAVVIGVSACTAVKPEPPPEDVRALEVASCRELYPMLDARVTQARVADAQYARIAGYPYLRIDRFLASDDIKPVPGSDEFDAWVERLRDLDLDARRVELKNLPTKGEDVFGDRIDSRLEECSALLVSADLTTAPARLQLLESASVVDNYSISKRVFGLYPLTSLPFKAGVSNLHDSMRADFSRSLDSLPVEGRLTRYRPPPATAGLSVDSVASLAAAADPLGIPELSPADLQRLFDAYAPIYEIDVISDDDRIGSVFWSGDEKPSVDVSRPVVYRRVSYTRFEGHTLLQLNYSVWFPSRPSDGSFDLLSGRLDGITFRVTLGRDARPLIYDSMHNCGCYHLFLPTMRLMPRPPSGAHEEPTLVAQHVALDKGRVVLRIAHSSHYLQRLYFDTQAGEGPRYAFGDDDSLRSLPLENGGRRSLFAPDGLVIGSERGERWLFWPMGIAEPGAMRQWGTHATAFVGTRHFDDPDLMERYFRSVE
jgi:hypothetical protein